MLEILPELPASTAVLLRGDHGIGKSSIVRQASERLSQRQGIRRRFIDRRLSQMQAGDLLGLPSLEGRCTRWNPPDWFHEACLEPCDLCLDELNRADREVMQAAFQLVLDRELAGWQLHPETRVYACINCSSLYDVHPMDPALLDRFWVADVVLATSEWLDHAAATGVHFEVRAWIAREESFLFPVVGADPGEKEPSPRSVERMARAVEPTLVRLEAAEAEQRAALFETLRVTAAGYIGVPAAMSFVAHLKDHARLGGKDVLERWRDVRSRIDVKRVDLMRDLIVRVVEELDRNHVVMGVPRDTDGPEELEPTQKQMAWAKMAGANVEAFLWDCQSELRPYFFQLLARLGIERLPLIKSVHPYFVKPIVEGTFGVPVGEAGIGVMPKAAFLDQAELQAEKE